MADRVEDLAEHRQRDRLVPVVALTAVQGVVPATADELVVTDLTEELIVVGLGSYFSCEMTSFPSVTSVFIRGRMLSSVFTSTEGFSPLVKKTLPDPFR